MLVGVFVGCCLVEYWDGIDLVVDFFDVKVDVEVLLGFIGKGKYVSFKVEMYFVLYLGMLVVIYFDDVYIGWLGVVYL